MVEQGCSLRLPRWVGQEGRLVAASCWRAQGWIWRGVGEDIGGGCIVLKLDEFE